MQGQREKRGVASHRKISRTHFKVHPLSYLPCLAFTLHRHLQIIAFCVFINKRTLGIDSPTFEILIYLDKIFFNNIGVRNKPINVSYEHAQKGSIQFTGNHPRMVEGIIIPNTITVVNIYPKFNLVFTFLKYLFCKENRRDKFVREGTLYLFNFILSFIRIFLLDFFISWLSFVH